MSIYCDYEAPEFYLSKYHKAKKVYSCEECVAIINVGEKYCYTVGKWDGDLVIYRQHLDCEEACRYIRDIFNHDCVLFGDLINSAHEMEYSSHDYKKTRRYLDFRSIMAKVIYRNKKNRPLKFFKPMKIHNEYLARDRDKGCGS